MPANDLASENYIALQLNALQQERDALKEQYNDGALAKNDYKVLLAKNAFLQAQLIEQNQQQVDNQKEHVFERKRDMFND